MILAGDSDYHSSSNSVIPFVLISWDFPVWENFPFSGEAFFEWPPPVTRLWVAPGA